MSRDTKMGLGNTRSPNSMSKVASIALSLNSSSRYIRSADSSEGTSLPGRGRKARDEEDTDVDVDDGGGGGGGGEFDGFGGGRRGGAGGGRG